MNYNNTNETNFNSQQDEIKKIKKEGKYTALITATTILSALTFGMSAMTMAYNLDIVSPHSCVDFDEIPSEVVQAKADELSKIFNCEFIADSGGTISTVFTNNEGAIYFSIDIDDNGSISYSSIEMLNMNKDKELSVKAEEFIKYAAQLSEHPEEVLKILSETTDKYASKEYLNSPEYKSNLEDLNFWISESFNNGLSSVDFSTLDPSNPERSLTIDIWY